MFIGSTLENGGFVLFQARDNAPSFQTCNTLGAFTTINTIIAYFQVQFLIKSLYFFYFKFFWPMTRSSFKGSRQDPVLRAILKTKTLCCDNLKISGIFISIQFLLTTNRPNIKLLPHLSTFRPVLLSTPMGVDYVVIGFDMEVQPLVTHKAA